MATVSVQSSKLSKSERRQLEVMEVAADLFLEAGFDGVSLDAIIDRSGGSKTRIYKDFGGKKSLFNEAIGRRCHLILASTLVGIPMDLAPREALRAFSLAFLQSVLSKEAVALHRTIAAEADRFPDLAEAFFVAGPKNVYDALTTYFTQLQSQGLLRGGKPADFARQFHGMVLSELQMAQLFRGAAMPGKQELLAHIDRSIETFLVGIQSPADA